MIFVSQVQGKMEITKEAYLNGERISLSTVVIDVCCERLFQDIGDLEASGSAKELATISELLIRTLHELLDTLRPVYAAQDDLVINLNMSELKYSMDFWEQLLYVAVTRAKFPLKVYITEQTDMDRSKYIKVNKALHTFTANIQRHNHDEEASGYEYEYETLLKMTIMTIIRKQNVKENEIEDLLTRFHTLEQLIRFFETSPRSIT